MLTEYTKESFIPLALFNLYDSLEFKTYSDISKSNTLNINAKLLKKVVICFVEIFVYLNF